MNNIIEFCKKRLEPDKAYEAYKGKHFDALRSLADAPSEPHPTKLGKFSAKVSKNNLGETAFQRALFKARKAVLNLDGAEEQITWKDLELPVVFSVRSRRPCIDLIGHSGRFGSFLCELKYERKEAGGQGNLPDYAILQALLYYGVVERDHTMLDKHRVYRGNRRKFYWKDVSQSKTLMVLGNCNVWNKACQQENRKRITTLITDIHESLGIKLLFCCLRDDSFVGAVKDGRYEPKFDLPKGLKFPRLKMVDLTT